MCAQEVNMLALEKAESLARGGALKWASVVFCQPDQLSRLGFYRRREAQRNDSIQSRLKSAVRSYLDGVQQGLVQLRTSLAEIHIIQKSLSEAHAVLGGSQATLSNFEPLRQLVMEHVQLSAVTQSLPCLSTVADMAYQTHLLIERRCLLEAHAKLRDFEILRDDVLYRLHRAATLRYGVLGPFTSDLHGVGAEGAVSAAQLEVAAWVQEIFAGVQDLSGDLGRVIFSLAGSPISVALSDPALLVSAVRVVEREEYLDAEESRGPLQKLWKPPGRPKHWRDGFFQALERGVCERLLPSGLDEDQVTPAGLVRHLRQLQDRLLAEMQAVCSVLTPCVPPHYEISRSVASICHQAIAGHLREILSLELAHPALYCVLRWILVVFPSEEIMGHPDLSLEVDFSELGLLVPPELMEEQLSRYARAVRGCLSQWMHKALEVEYSDWFRSQEPDKDQEGFYLSSLPQLLMQMLVENVRLASALGTCLESRVRIVAVQEMENCLLWLREALVKYSTEHVKDKLAPAFYIPYLLAILNGCALLSSSVSCLQPEIPVCPGARRAAPCLRTALDKTQKKTCRLYLDELQTEMQPLFEQIPSRPWLLGSDIALKVCEKVESFSQHLSGVRPPLCQFLRTQTERVLVIEYVKALVHGKLVCKNGEERRILAERMSADAEMLRAALARMGLEESSLCSPLILSLQELFALKDPSFLSLEVSRLMGAFPDISDDHVVALLELRGDVTKDLRHEIVTMMHQQVPPLPPDYQTAICILCAVLKQYRNYDRFQALTRGSRMSNGQVWASYRRYMRKEGCSGETHKRAMERPQRGGAGATTQSTGDRERALSAELAVGCIPRGL